MKNEQVFEKLALDKEITKKIFGGVFDGKDCVDQQIQQCSASVIKYDSVQCKLNGVWVKTFCAHPEESEQASTHPTAGNIPHYYCYEPIA